MALMDLLKWVQQPAANTDTAVGDDDDLVADVDEPPDLLQKTIETLPRQDDGFQRSVVRPKNAIRAESLLTRALQCPEADLKPQIQVATDLTRRRSVMSTASIASTAELTSDGGLTSPARTNTPSPPFPRVTYTSFAPYSSAAKTPIPPVTAISNIEMNEALSLETVTHDPASPAQPIVVTPPKKRCISFACGGRKDPVAKPAAPPVPESTVPQTTAPVVEAPKRTCKIKFACGGNNQSVTTDTLTETETPKLAAPKNATASKGTETVKRNATRSPPATRKSLRPPMPARAQRDSSSTIRKASLSPVAIRSKAKYMDLDEKTIQASEATRFHEFASEQMQDDDWIRKDSENPREKLTINDTLKKENVFRRLGTEAEQEEQDENEDDDINEHDSDEEIYGDEDDEDEDDEDEYGEDDGNETDNEAGFADSDDESDGGEFAFWTPGRKITEREIGETARYRALPHRTASASSIDSLNHMSPLEHTTDAKSSRRRPIKIRPGTPDLPDSTDFVCGTLDEDRPLEDAYVSCMEARKNAKRKQTPQDIDPSFPISDPENEEDEQDAVESANDSEEHVWLHGNFEDSDEGFQGRRRSTANRRKSPTQSPRRFRSPAPNGRRLQSPPPPARKLHSPPPTKTRLRSPPPRKLFGHSPKRMHSPSAQTGQSPSVSPTSHATSLAIPFAPLGSRPGLTHTKSLPRTPNAFCRQYRATQLIAANGNNIEAGMDGQVRRKAIDIVKGLERKRHYRKEKFYKGKGKCQIERRPLPGKGAERMREVGLHMAGRTATGAQAPYMLSA